MAEKKISRILKVLVAVTFLLMFVIINVGELVWGAILYLIMFFFCIFMYSSWGKFGRFSDLEGLDNKWGINSLIGIGLGIGVILLGRIVGFVGTIAIPPVQSIAGVVGRFIIVCIAAPVLEEVFFRDFQQDLFQSKFRVPKYLSILIVAISFALFHLTAYAGSSGSLQAAGGSFFSAAVMGFVFGLVVEWRNSLAVSIAMHMTLNIYIGFVLLNVIV